jgi:ABC-type proline/glycine betaine transport system ATPase subunit
MKDVQIVRHGSGLFLFHILTRNAENFVDEFVDDSNAQWFGGALVVETRYALNLANGMRQEGLEIR